MEKHALHQLLDKLGAINQTFRDHQVGTYWDGEFITREDVNFLIEAVKDAIGDC